MSSDLPPDSPDEEPAPKKAQKQILESEIQEGLHALDRPTGNLFLSGLSAGLEVGFSVLLMAVMTSVCKGKLPEPVVAILVANMYSIGFIFVVLGRSELFTEQTTLAVLPVLSRETSVGSLLRLWTVVFVSNVIGAAIFAKGIAAIAPALGAAHPEDFTAIAMRLADHSAGVIFFSALLAGWLMGLLSWLVAAGRDTISQIVFVWLITTCIGFVGLHHVILGCVEVFAGAFSGPGIGGAAIARFMVMATLGNIVGGGIFVALLKFGQADPDDASKED